MTCRKREAAADITAGDGAAARRLRIVRRVVPNAAGTPAVAPITLPATARLRFSRRAARGQHARTSRPQSLNSYGILLL
jgi:hypothetical protein